MVDFSASDYWESRFNNALNPFDWLESPTDILPRLRQIIEVIPFGDRSILHIGSGSSSLSLLLRGFVSSPRLVHNVDFSNAGIKFGMDMERDAIEADWQVFPPRDGDYFMSWSQANLLSMDSIRQLRDPPQMQGQYNIIVDKGTSDAIACGSPLELQSSTFSNPAETLNGKNPKAACNHVFKVYPVWLLALHMAVLTTPGALWIAITYKDDRFDFLNPNSGRRDLGGQDLPQHLLPATYWVMQSQEVVAGGSQLSIVLQDGSTYYPQAGHRLFVLRRTTMDLDLSNGMSG